MFKKLESMIDHFSRELKCGKENEIKIIELKNN